MVYCESCDVYCDNTYNYIQHFTSTRHLQRSTADYSNILIQRNNYAPLNYHCVLCDKFFDDNKWNYEQHLRSSNHAKKAAMAQEPEFAQPEKKQIITEHKRAVVQQCDELWSCNKCLKNFGNFINLKQHLCTAHTTTPSTIKLSYRCETCNREFSTIYLRNKHARLHIKGHTCVLCQSKFMYKRLLQKHITSVHRTNRRGLNLCNRTSTTMPKNNNECFNCKKSFSTRWALNRHLKVDCNAQCISQIPDDLLQSCLLQWTVQSALRGCISLLTAIPKHTISVEKIFFEDACPTIKKILRFLINNNCPIKWSFALDVTFTKTAADGEVHVKNATFSCKRHAFNNNDNDDVKKNVEIMVADVASLIDKFCSDGSKWLLQSIDQLQLHLYRIILKNGGSSVELTAFLKAKKCVINIDSNFCFKYGVLASLHCHEVYPPNRATNYLQWDNEFVFPSTPVVNAADVQIFSKSANLAIYTHVWNEKQQVAECSFHPPLHAAKTLRRVHLLLYKQHWMAITNLSALYTTSASKIYMCDLCLAKFHDKNRFVQHQPCTPISYIQNEIMPTAKPYLKFDEFNKCVPLSDVIYADLEAILEHVDSATILQKHVPCCVGAYQVSTIEGNCYSEFSGKDCMQQFVVFLDATCRRLFQRNKSATRKPADKTVQEMHRHESAVVCMWCHMAFDDSRKRKVFDHDHVTGAYVGAACSTCNLKRRQDRNTLVVVFHNFRGYDSHALCLQGLANMPEWELKPIAQNPEKYIALMAYLNIGGARRAATFRIKFVDSLQIMPSSLASLVSNLVGTNNVNYSKLVHSSKLLNIYPLLSIENIAAKGIFPYSYASSWERLEDTKLPPLSEFYNDLEEAITVTNEDYVRAQQMFLAFNCQTLAEYQLRYLELDCRLLADVCEEFRHVIMKEDSFDPLHFFTISMLSYSSALKWSNATIGLIQEEEIYRDVERCKRGGYSFVNKHWCVASNPYVGRSNSTNASDDVYLGNIDANNLYGNALRYPLPVGDFKYLDKAAYSTIDWLHIDTKGDVGYFVVCDLHYPPSIHHATQNLPLAPELADITYDDFSPYMKEMFVRRNLSRNPECKNPEKYNTVAKLLATCRDKKEYVVHFLVLQLYLQLGMKISRIYRVIQFKQAPIFKDYIDFNTSRRSAAVNDFEKDMYKQKNCSLFGKSLENKRNRCDVVLCNSHNKMINAASDHRFKQARIFDANFAAACLTKCNVELDSPIAIGASVLDISKYIMYKLAYIQLPRYEKMFDCRIEIVGGDTDSFFIEVKGVDMISVLYPQMAADGLLDTSNYPHTHSMFSNVHKAELDCIKDEFAGMPYKEFILLRPKAYSMLPASGEVTASKRKCKGIVKRKVKMFTHEDFKSTFLCQREVSAHCRRMQPKLHVVYNVNQYKIALSFSDDKRCWYSNNFSLPYGHVANDYYTVFPPDDEDIIHRTVQSNEDIVDELFPPTAKHMKTK